MLEGLVADYWSRGKQHLIFDVLLGWLFNCFITGGICDLFQELETNKGIVFNSPLRTEIGYLVFLFVAARLKNEEYISCLANCSLPARILLKVHNL